MTNCYKILGTKDFASLEEIKTAYRKLSKKFHPDVNNGDAFFEERFKEIQAAYEVLTDDEERARHDAELRKSVSSNNSNFHHKEYGRYASTGRYSSTAGRQREKKKQTGAIVGGAFLLLLIIVLTWPSNDKQERSREVPEQMVQRKRTSDNNEGATVPPVSAEAPLAANDSFTLGSSKEEVLRIQGAPESIRNFETIGEVWFYDEGTVTFNNEKVTRFTNSFGYLKASMP